MTTPNRRLAKSAESGKSAGPAVSAVSAKSTKSANAGTATHRASARAPSLFLDNQLCFALYATSLAMTKVYRPLLAPLGLTYPQYIVMLALWEHRELTVGKLGDQVALDSGTLVPLIRKLTAQGLVLRQRSSIDDRSVLISLTPAGVQMSERAHAVHDQVACTTQRTPAERQAIVGSLHGLRVALLQDTAPKPPV